MLSRFLVAALLLILSGLSGSSTIASAGGAPADEGLTPDPLALVSPSRPYQTNHTRLDLDLDLQAQRIAGSVTHEMTSLRGGLAEIALNCVGLEIESVLLNDKETEYEYPVPGKHSTSWFQSIDVSTADAMLVIESKEPLARGETFTVEVRYRGAPKKGLYWIAPEKGIPDKRYEVWSQGEGENNRYWIPCNDYPNDKSTFEGVFRVKRGYYVLSNGALVSQRDVGDKTEFVWRLEAPQVSYLIMVAAGKYDVHEEDWNGIPLLYVVPPGTPKDMVERAFGWTPAMMEFFTETIGIDYPFEKYAQVVVQNYIHGGMENTTATVLNMRMLHDARSYLTRNNQGLVAHELAHMWWGDMVTCREWSHMWLNEGFATYYQALFRKHYEGDDAFRYEVFERHQRTVARDDNDARPVVTDFYNRKDGRNSANVYIKGSSVLHMLRFMLGDEQFHAVIKHYGERHMHEVVETADLVRAVKDVTGENLDWFFEQWLFLAGHPKFEISKDWDRETHMLHLNVKQTQETSKLVPVFRVPLDIEVTCEEQTEIYRIVVDRADQDFYFSLPSKPKMVIFDKGSWILKTSDFPKPVEELVYQLDHGDYMDRVHAARALGKQGSKTETVPALRQALLADGHYGLRREAALALGMVGTEEARSALLEGVEAIDARVRLASAEALGTFDRDEIAARELLGLLRTDQAYGVRARAVTSLVQMKSAQAELACREALKQESDRSIVRNAGLNGLADLEDPKALGLVKRYAGPGNDRNHRHTAIAAYARLGKELENDRSRKSAAGFLADMLDDWYLRTRREVMNALGTLGEKSAVTALRKAESKDPLESLRSRAGRMADRLESGKGAGDDFRSVESQVRGLENKIETMEKELEELRRKIPEPPPTPGTASTTGGG